MSAVKRYRKKPVVVDAWQIETYHDLEPIADWIIDNGGTAAAMQHDPGAAFLGIVTPEGTMSANIGDYVIRGVKGEFYPCKPDIFAATYEEAER